MNITFTPEARGDLRDIHRQIAQDNERAADNVIARIRQTIMIFERFPMLGRIGRLADTREFAIPGMSYTIVYRVVSETELDILTIVHQRRLYPPED